MADSRRGRLVVLRSPESSADRGIVAYAAFEVVLDEMHLHTLAVAPGFRERGLGRKLLRIVLGLGAGRGADSVLLEARQSNWAALALYRSFDFEVIFVRRGYYDRPKEDALVLRKTGLNGQANR